jgi:hypothetical protein
MVEKSKEFYGWDMKLEYRNSGFYHWQSDKKQVKDKILVVEASMWLSINGKKDSRKMISYFISRHFECVDTSFTWEEVKHFSIPGAYKTIKFKLTLGDFPKLLESYKKFLEQQSEYITFLDKRSKASTDGTKFVNSREDYKSMVEERIKLEKSLQKHNQEIEKMFEYYKDGYMRLWECSNGKAPEIDPELSKTFG